MDWIPWDVFRCLFKLNPRDKDTYDVVLDATLFSLWTKVRKFRKREWWKYWVWVKEIPFKNYKPSLGYEWISLVMPLGPLLNHGWDLIYALSQWKARFLAVWNSYIEPKQAFFPWSMLHQSLPLGKRITYVGVSNPTCAFLQEDESTMHMFWECRRSKEA